MENLPELAWADRSDLLIRTDAFVYRVRDAAGSIIYIGMTLMTLEERFAAHLHDPALWWKRAASIEAARVSRSEARQVESDEIHRHHPEYNRQCALCGRAKIYSQRYAIDHPLYTTWLRLTRVCPGHVHQRWHDPRIFLADIDQLLGPRPAGMKFCRIVSGMYEPGNVCWGRGGPPPRTR